MIRDNQCFMTWPYVAGFSFSAKCWGELLAESLEDIIFDDKAYDLLVICEDKKTLIQALVECPRPPHLCFYLPCILSPFQASGQDQ